MEILLVGEAFSAREALQMGLVNYVVPRGRVIDKALELADKLAANGPLALRKIKEGVLRASGRPLQEALRIESEVSAAVMASRDARGAPRAFRERRPPRFTGE